MKKSSFIGIFICVFLFSCDMNKKKDPGLILGTWSVTNIESKISGNATSFIIERILNEQIKNYTRLGGEITFLEDNTFNEKMFNTQGSYSVSIDEIVLKTKPKELKFTLLKLNENTLKASIDLTNELSNLGINLSDYLSGDISVSAVITCEKIPI